MTRSIFCSPAELYRYRGYLQLLASSKIHRSLASKLDASDLVQLTLVYACNHLHEFRGDSEQSLLAWLRQILSSTLIDQVRRFHRDCRDVRLEQSLPTDLDQSSVRLFQWLADSGPTPSHAVMLDEQLTMLCDAIQQLPADQRMAIVLQRLQDCSIAEIAERMQRSEMAVGGLLRRAMKQLRAKLDPQPLEGAP